MGNRSIKQLTKEEINSIDSLLAKYLLIDELCHIPEFVRLWDEARLILKPVMEIVSSNLKKRFLVLSPEARNFLLQSSDTDDNPPGKEAIHEAWEFRSYLQHVQRTLNEEFNDLNLKANYTEKINAIVEPLGIPCFSDDILLWDMRFWFSEIYQLLFELEKGFTSDLFESQVMRFATGLGPAELAAMTPHKAQQRTMQKVAPLGRHHSRYRLRQRIRLWVHNVVLGETQEQIAVRVQNDKEWLGVGLNPFEWVRKQIHDANHILGVVRKGRPPKGGALRQWKMMVE